MTKPHVVLFVGATGSIGRLAVEEAVRQGYTARALVRSRARASFPEGVQIAVGDLTDAATLGAALEGVDGVVFTMGANGTPAQNEAVDYGAVRNVLQVLAGRPVRISLMTLVGATHTGSAYDRRTQAVSWKRRSERLVRGSGNEYTIVRPGWFDCNGPGENRLEFRQGDDRPYEGPGDGAVARRDIARTLVAALGTPEATGKTLELVAVRGDFQADLTPLFAALEADRPGSLDGVHDADNFPLSAQPQRVLDDLRRIDGLALQ